MNEELAFWALSPTKYEDDSYLAKLKYHQNWIIYWKEVNRPDQVIKHEQRLKELLNEPI